MPSTADSRLPSITKIFVILLLLFGGLSLYNSFWRATYRPVHRIALPEWPKFSDDMDTRSLLSCLQEQSDWLAEQKPETLFIFDDEVYDLDLLQNSIYELMQMVRQNPTPAELNQFLKEHFILYQAGGRKGYRHRQMLVTGYYEPVFNGSPIRTEEFVYPIYAKPTSLVSRKVQGVVKTGRLDQDGKIIPFWSREELENTDVLVGSELAWLRNPFDAYLLHVQGSGMLRFSDGTLHAVRFAGSNGLEYMSIGKLLIDEGLMQKEDVTVPAIRQYLIDHPEQRDRILQHNPRFIFFSWGDDRGPRGSSGRPLTPGRSIAIDNAALPPGTIAYLVTQKPLFGKSDKLLTWEPLTRFVCPQDTGSAIKGTGRVDVFWGNSHYAELAASHMKESGSLYFLIAK